MTLAGIGRKGPVGDTQVGLLTAAGSSDCDLLCDARVAAGRVVTSRTKQTPLSLAGGYDSFTVALSHSYSSLSHSYSSQLHWRATVQLSPPAPLGLFRAFSSQSAGDWTFSVYFRRYNDTEH